MSSRFHPLLRLTIFAVGAVVAQFAVVLVAGAALLVAAQMAHRAPTDAFSFIERNLLLITVLTYPPTLLWLWFCRRKFDRSTFSSLSLRARGAGSLALSGALCGLLALSLLFAVLTLSGQIRIDGFSPEWKTEGARSLGFLGAYLLGFCAVGFFEEIVFRGYALHNLTAWLGLKSAIWIQAIGFGLIHLPNVFQKIGPRDSVLDAFWDARWGIFNVALIGVFFAFCYLKTGSLWFPIGFHVAWNFLLGCVFSLPVSGISTFRVLDVQSVEIAATGGAFGLEGSVYLVGILAALLWLMSREPNDAQALTDLSTLRPDILTTQTDEIADAEIDDATHIPRFRTSMRSSSLRPTLEFASPNFAALNTQSGFALSPNAPSAPKAPASLGALSESDALLPDAPSSPDATFSSAPPKNVAVPTRFENATRAESDVSVANDEISAPKSDAPSETVSPVIAQLRARPEPQKVSTPIPIATQSAPEKTVVESAPTQDTPPTSPPPKPKKPAPKW